MKRGDWMKYENDRRNYFMKKINALSPVNKSNNRLAINCSNFKNSQFIKHIIVENWTKRHFVCAMRSHCKLCIIHCTLYTIIRLATRIPKNVIWKGNCNSFSHSLWLPTSNLSCELWSSQFFFVGRLFILVPFTWRGIQCCISLCWEAMKKKIVQKYCKVFHCCNGIPNSPHHFWIEFHSSNRFNTNLMDYQLNVSSES